MEKYGYVWRSQSSGKDENVTDRLHNFRFYEDRYPCRGGGRRGGRPIANGKNPQKGERAINVVLLFYLICLPAQRGT